MTANNLKARAFRLMTSLPGLKQIKEKELSKVDQTIGDKFRDIFDEQTFLTRLPAKGLSADQILADLNQYESIGKIDWRKGRASGQYFFLCFDV